jgi:hypothetical protein
MLWIVIPVIIFAFVFLWYEYSHSTNEGFVERTTQSDRISSIQDILMDPEDAEAVADTFYERLNDRNMEIRKKTIQYFSAEDITPQERSIIRDAYQYARATYPLPIQGQFQIVITGNETEGGMPHTHGNVIYISRKKVQESTEFDLRNTLLHEMSHIHQRQKQYLWEKLYSNLGFQRLPIGWALPAEIRDKVLANPDTWNGGDWEYKGQHGVMIINDDAKSVKDFTYQIIPVRDGVNMSVNHLKKTFGKVTRQIDHPGEITASGLEKFISTGDTGSPELTNALRCWLDECRADIPES